MKYAGYLWTGYKWIFKCVCGEPVKGADQILVNGQQKCWKCYDVLLTSEGIRK